MKPVFVLLSCISAFQPLDVMTEESEKTVAYQRVESKERYPILNPALSGRTIVKLRLANGISAYLISDPNTEQSGAAVCVGSGSWQDPPEYPGTAHFLEHMLFLGSEAYPSESEYTKYIKDNGGSVNAFTASDKTAYAFSVNHTAFEGALDRFSHFFRDPLFSLSGLGRELQAVDQEFTKNLEHDGWRIFMVLKETGNPDHPYRKFGTGNAKTLSGISPDILRQWYRSHYTGNNMYLTVISPMKEEALIDLVVSKFSPIPETSPNEQVSLMPKTPIFSEKQHGSLLYIQPIKERKVLSLLWELPEEFTSCEGAWIPSAFCYILNDRSETSLFRKLQEKGLARSMTAQTDKQSTTGMFLHIEVSLTEEGVKQPETVIAFCHKAVDDIRKAGLPERLAMEIEKLERLRYQYQSRQPVFTEVLNTAALLPEEDLSTFPENLSVPSSLSQEAFDRLLTHLTPDTCLYPIMADPKLFPVSLDQTETWTKVPYALHKIDASRTNEALSNLEQTLISLPSPNPFIAENMELLPCETPLRFPKPERLKTDLGSDVYFLQDTRYQLPDASYLFELRSSRFDGSPLASVLLDLLTLTVSDMLADTIYRAEAAGISCFFAPSPFGLRVTLSGYHDKAPLLWETVIPSLRTIRCDEKTFNRHKNTLLIGYRNEAFELPVKQAVHTGIRMSISETPNTEDKRKILENLSFQEFSLFAQKPFPDLHTKALLYGNLTRAEATNVLLKHESVFDDIPKIADCRQQTIRLLSEERGPCKISYTTEALGNGTVLILQSESSPPKKNISLNILSLAIGQAFFDTLRTKQQTGYIAQSWLSETGDLPLLFFAVQSSSHLPEDLLGRFEAFLEDFSVNLPHTISEEEFLVLKNTAILDKKIPPETGYSAACQLFSLAFESGGDFSKEETEIQALEDLSYERFLQESKAFLGTKNRRRLAVLYEGKQTEKMPLRYQEISPEIIVQGEPNIGSP